MSEKKVIDKRIAIAVGVICIVLLAGLTGTIANYTTIINNKDNTIQILTIEKNQLQTWLDGNKTLLQTAIRERDLLQRWLNGNITNYESRIRSLNAKITTLQLSYDSLKASYDELYSDTSILNKDYSDITSYYRRLSNNVTELYNLLYSYSRIPDAFSRTLNDVEVLKTSSAVLSAGISSDFWSSLQKIYDYIISNIKYSEDIDMPYPSTYWHVYFDGFDYIT